MKHINLIFNILLFLVLFAFSIKSNKNQFGQFPNGIHTWSQSDHYALARGFVENDLDFFHPRTFTYPYMYPGTWNPDNHSLITSVDFPIHDYIPAVIMKISGSNSTLIFQLYTLIISLIGLVYLYKLGMLVLKSPPLSLLLVAFVAFSPVFAFYQIRYIPSVPSFSTAIIGVYFALLYRQTKTLKFFIIGTLLLGLSAMTRMTFVIVYGAWIIQAISDLRKDQTHLKKQLIWILLSSGLFLGYFFYNHYLRSTYGSLFISELLPANSWSEFMETITYIINTWKYDYITKAHYLLVLLAMITLIILLFKRKWSFPKELPKVFVFLTFVGSIVFFLAMCVQFRAHDYYFIDAILLPLLFIQIILLYSIKILFKSRPSSLILLCVFFSGGMVYLNHKAQIRRIESESWGGYAKIDADFKKSAELINKLRIPGNAPLVVLDAVPWNVPFLYMNRTGYVVMKTRKQYLKESLSLDANYYVFQNDNFISTIYKTYPKIIKHLEIIGTDGKITICKKVVERNKSLLDFLELNKRPAVFERKLIDEQGTEWETKGIKNEIENSFQITSKDEFGPVLKLRNNPLFNHYRIVYFTGEINWDHQFDIQCVLSLTEKGELTSYKTFSLEQSLGKKVGWQSFQFLMTVPATTKVENELSVYLWNSNKTNYRVRNVNCKLF